jgi:hypothetical protein
MKGDTNTTHEDAMQDLKIDICRDKYRDVRNCAQIMKLDKIEGDLSMVKVSVLYGTVRRHASVSIALEHFTLEMRSS